MKYDPKRHHRHSIRLKEYDYAQAGAYFVTICTKGRECVLDDPVVEGIIIAVWHALPGWFPTIELDEFVVMPNHVHLIVWILSPDEVEASLADTNEAGANGAGANGAGANGAGARPAPTSDDVGATLAVAQLADETGASPVPTDGMVDVGASLADANDVDAEDWARASLAPTEWVIPKPDAVNMVPSLGDVMGAFKSLVFMVYLDWIEAHDPTRRAKFWQRNYYEHIIRSEVELNAIRQYISDNPAKWAQDRDNPIKIRPAAETMAAYLSEVGL